MTPLRALVLAIACTACAADTGPTQLVVEVDTDVPAPGISDVTVTVEGPNGERTAQGDTGLGELAFPVSVGVLAPSDDPGADVRIRAMGTLFGSPGPSTIGFEQQIITRFLPGESRLVRLELLQACLARMCSADETCIVVERTPVCTNARVDPAGLPVWTGE